MLGLGTIINTGCIIVGGLFGLLFGRFFKERHQDTLTKTCGVATMFIGISGALSLMLKVNDDFSISTQSSLLVIVCLALGAVIGELINIDGAFEKFGCFLRDKTGNANDKSFVNAFVTASFTVCIGAMAIIGAINDGISNDYSVLILKGILDFIIIMCMTASLGKGCIFSALPVFVLQFSVTLLAKVIAPVLTDAALANLSLVGSILIFCVGLNLVFDKKIRVANLLPAIILAILLAYLPINI